MIYVLCQNPFPTIILNRIYKNLKPEIKEDLLKFQVFSWILANRKDWVLDLLSDCYDDYKGFLKTNRFSKL